ncbi:dienelactone hydrolase family protein [Isoptericola sp. b490]|uniref:dienelactone hydrolase family protein n=1 Tax=Actinotalea lenta TaxID=3064654 RepID=UPI002713CE4F|nr:dienelactone hydrolase family protein [Isoptericola sp. b490]MDO8120613.1 dienelactone hydrolase family protein [Isoptericola sp. b490]
MPQIELSTARGSLPAFLARPSGDGPWPGVVLLHDAFGMTTQLRRHAEWLAAAGYRVLAPDLMSWAGRTRCLWSLFGSLRSRRGRVFEEIEAARSWLAGHPDGTGQVGVIGFCMGGGFALLVVPGGAFDVASVNYGVGVGTPDPYGTDFLAGACPVVGSYGGADRSLRGAAGRLAGSLGELGVAHDVKEYPDAGHSFMDAHVPSEVPGLVRLATRAMGPGYVPDAADDARARIVGFFAEHLRGPERSWP